MRSQERQGHNVAFFFHPELCLQFISKALTSPLSPYRLWRAPRHLLGLALLKSQECSTSAC